jgi:hypothetical protein
MIGYTYNQKGYIMPKHFRERTTNYVGTFKFDCELDQEFYQSCTQFLKKANKHLKKTQANYRLRLKRHGRGSNRVARAMDYYTNRYPMLLNHNEEYRHRVVANMVSQSLPLCCAESYDLYLYRKEV